MFALPQKGNLFVGFQIGLATKGKQGMIIESTGCKPTEREPEKLVMTTLIHEDLVWCLRMLPKEVFAALMGKSHRLVLAGGYIRSRVSGEVPNDIDLFVTSKDDALATAYMLAKSKDDVHATQNAYTVTGFLLPIQVIHRWAYQTPTNIIPSFDFTIARAAIWHDSTTATWLSECDDRFYCDLAAKRLTYCSPDRNEDAGGSLLRVLKFYQRGYRIPMDSFGAVVARLVQGVDLAVVGGMDEFMWAKVLTGLLREVDPNIDPTHNAHLPSSSDDELRM
jgi:hypothetical protein